jgi:hypothetical protein
MLFTDHGTPSVLTGYAQESLLDAKNLHNQHVLPENSLARWMPNRKVPGLKYEYNSRLEEGSGLASYRAWDAEVPESKDSAKEVIKNFRLAPLSDKARLSEETMMEILDNDDVEVKKAILKQVENRALAVATTVEIARAEALFEGKVTIPAFKTVIDFKRHASSSVTAGTAWSAPGATPLTNLLAYLKTYKSQTGGEEAGAILTSQDVVDALYSSEEIKTLLDVPFLLPSHVDALLRELRVPQFITNDLRFGQVGNKQRITPNDKLVLLPAPGAVNDEDGNGYAATLWTRSNEARSAEYDLAGVDSFGIVVGSYKVPGSPSIWVKSDAVVLPTLLRPEYTFAAKVL